MTLSTEKKIWKNLYIIHFYVQFRFYKISTIILIIKTAFVYGCSQFLHNDLHEMV